MNEDLRPMAMRPRLALLRVEHLRRALEEARLELRRAAWADSSFDPLHDRLDQALLDDDAREARDGGGTWPRVFESEVA